MGNICGKTEPDNFSQPGRVVGSVPPQAPQTAPVPKKVGGPPRTLGGSSPVPASSEDREDQRRRAAAAAEARAKSANKTTGKLGSQLQAQKKQTRVDTLNEASYQELRSRDADAAAESRAHN